MANPPTRKRPRIRIRPSRAYIQVPPFRRPVIVQSADFHDLTELVRDLYGRSYANERMGLLRALEAASHRIGAS